MTPTSFKETNLVLDAGDNPNTDQLPVCIAKDPDYPPGICFIVSKWKLSPEELEEVNKTGEIWVSVMGHSTPPIMPLAVNPFEHLGYIPVPIIKPGKDQ